MVNSNSSTPRVAVVGAGMAGLTAALKLARRGYQVTLFEATDVIGGNLSSQRVPIANGDGAVYHDVYPHMFCTWYNNFWTLLKDDLHLERDELFEPRAGVKLLDPGDSEYKQLKYPSDVKSVIENLRSGVQTPADLWIYGYALIDLAAHEFDFNLLLNRSSVEGFLDGKYYSTEGAAELFDLVLSEIWAVHFSHTSAAAYQKFARQTITFPHYAPFAWVLRGSLEQKLMAPMRSRLEEAGCEIRLEHKVETVIIEENRIALEVLVNGNAEEHFADQLILAVPPSSLGRLVRHGPEGRRIVDFEPSLSEVRRLRADAIPVVDLYLKRKIADMPIEHVALRQSPSELTAVDISHLWTDDPYMANHTVLVLAASNNFALISPVPEEDGFAMISEYHRYRPEFELGEYWGDPNSDIDWERTFYRSNDNRRLYINTVGSVPSIPYPSYDALPSVYFAGDFCITDVGMATVESATISGLDAARALWERHPVGEPIEVADLGGYSRSTLLAFKLLLGPSTYAARWWTLGREIPGQLADGDLKAASRSAAMMWRLPSAYAGDLMDTGYNFVASLFGNRADDDNAKPGVSAPPQ